MGIHATGPKPPEEWDQIPRIGDPGSGVHRCQEKTAGIAVDPDGVNRTSGNRPQLADAFARGRSVHGNDAAGTCAQRLAWLMDWFGRLRDRLRAVRVCCGHCLRVCDSDSVTIRLGTTGIFFDPPYPHQQADGSHSRDANLYAVEGDVNRVRDEVLAYCLERGSDKRMRLCVAGYDTDGYAALESHGWDVVAWRTQGGYANRNSDNTNRDRERLWFSPYCIKNQPSLFDEME